MYSILDHQFMEGFRPTMRKIGSCCSILCSAAFLTFILMLLMVMSMDRNVKVHVVYMTGVRPKSVTSDKFLSIALDSSNIANGFKHFDVKNPRLLKMLQALSPAYLRVGGNMADRLIFTTSKSIHFKHNFHGELDGGECAFERTVCDHLAKPNFTMNDLEWLKLNKLARDTNLEIIFDLNVLRRFDNGSWDPSNAEKLIEFSNRHGLSLNWELGNEPNAFRHQFNYEVTPEQLAKDFRLLRTILNKYEKYQNSLLLGPDVTRPEINNNESMNYLKRFLPEGVDVVDAVTWHHYYFNGATAKIMDFLNPGYFDMLKWQLSTVKNLVVDGKPIWLGETSSAYGGGAPHLSDRYIACFIWLDKLGLAAKYGLSVVIRQAIVQGYYALVTDSYAPTPDWWVSVLYKKLVSNKVVECFTGQSPRVRLYCHCTKPERYFEGIPSVTIFGVNISNRKARIRFEGVSPFNNYTQMKKLKVHAYILDTLERIDSRYIYLNDFLLMLTKTHDLPLLLPKMVTADPYVVMPPFSLAFWVVPITGHVLSFC